MAQPLQYSFVGRGRLTDRGTAVVEVHEYMDEGDLDAAIRRDLQVPPGEELRLHRWAETAWKPDNKGNPLYAKWLLKSSVAYFEAAAGAEPQDDPVSGQQLVLAAADKLYQRDLKIVVDAVVPEPAPPPAAAASTLHGLALDIGTGSAGRASTSASLEPTAQAPTAPPASAAHHAQPTGSDGSAGLTPLADSQQHQAATGPKTKTGKHNTEPWHTKTLQLVEDMMPRYAMHAQ